MQEEEGHGWHSEAQCQGEKTESMPQPLTTSSFPKAAPEKQRGRGGKQRQLRNLWVRPVHLVQSSSVVFLIHPLWFFPFPPTPRRGAPLNTVLGKGERKVIVVARHGVRCSADGQRALEGQPVHGKLVGVDQPAVSRGSTRRASALARRCQPPPQACTPPGPVLLVTPGALRPTGRRTLRIPGLETSQEEGTACGEASGGVVGGKRQRQGRPGHVPKDPAGWGAPGSRLSTRPGLGHLHWEFSHSSGGCSPPRPLGAPRHALSQGRPHNTCAAARPRGLEVAVRVVVPERGPRQDPPPRVELRWSALNPSPLTSCEW